MAARQPQFSPKQIADALQASESSVKRWCDRDIIPTVRTIGGHRRITLDGLQRFLQVSGRTLLAPDALGLPTLTAGRKSSIPGGPDPDQQTFRNALADGDEATCEQILMQRVARGVSHWKAAEELITDAMRGIGEAWDCNQLDAYQERRGCGICLRLIYALRARLPAIAKNASTAIGGAMTGDPYQLPTALVELALRESGWNAVSLGNNLPVESLLQAAHDYQPKLVWLSVSAITGNELFIAQLNHLAAQLGDEVTLLVGGRALTSAIRSRLCYTAYCDSLKQLVDLAAIIQVQGRLGE